MAQQLRLENRAQTTTLDLLSGTFKMRPGGWRTATADQILIKQPQGYGARQRSEGFRTEIETIDLIAKGTDAAIRTAFNSLDDFKEKARLYHDDTFEDESVFLAWQSEGETVGKRALIYSIDYRVEARGTMTPLLGEGAVRVRLAVERHGLWERATTLQLTSSNVGGWGSNLTFAPTEGTAPARVDLFRIDDNASGGGPLDRFWVGGRPTRKGTTGLTTVWELESGTLGTDAAVESEVGASPFGSSTNNKVVVDFGTVTTNVKRVERNGGFLASHEGMVGRWLILLRAKLSAGSSEVTLEMRSGLTGGSGRTIHRTQFFSDTSWRLIEMGEVSMPPYGVKAETLLAGVGSTVIEIFAARLSGSADLELDAIGWVPTEHFYYLEGAKVEQGQAFRVDLRVTDADQPLMLGTDGVEVNASMSSVMRDIYLPVEGAEFVVFGERTTSHVLDDAVDLTLDYRPRWVSYRD
jgi:hypothetical protein